MKTEHQEELLKKYKHFFPSDRKIYAIHDIIELLNQEETVLPIQFGFECGDGWYMLLKTLMQNIESHLDPELSWPKKERIPFQIDQIKEKFGGLRFYFSGGDQRITGMVSLAENLSYQICEKCGSTKNVKQTQGWITTLCEDCYPKEI